MPARRLSAALLALAACGPPAADVPPPTVGPRLAFGADSVSFGTRFDDEAPPVTVVLTNVGGRPLHVERIEPSCACILVGEAPTLIAPGVSVDLPMEIRLAGLEGPFARVVAFHSDDETTPFARVTIEGEVRPRIAVEPPSVVAYPATLDAATSIDLVVKSGAAEPIGKLKVVCTAPWTTVTTAIAGDAARLHVAIEPFADDFRGSIVLRLGRSERIVPVIGRAARDVRVAPDELWIGSEEKDRTVRAALMPRDGLSAWRVVSVETDRKDLAASVKDGVLVVRIADDAPKGRFEGTVTIVLEGAKPDRVRVPVTGWVSD